MIFAFFSVLKLVPDLLPAYKIAGSVWLVVLGLVMAATYIWRRDNLNRVARWESYYSAGIVAFTMLIYYISAFVVLTDTYGLQNLLLQYKDMAAWIYVLICFAQPIVLPIPEVVTVVAGSTVLGAFQAFVLGVIGTTLGILSMFLLTRISGAKWIGKIVSEKHLSQYNRIVAKNEILFLAILFIIPVLPDEVICVGAAISGVNLRKFLMVALLSKIVTSFSLSYSIVLTEKFSLTPWMTTLILSSLVIFVYMAVFVLKRRSAGR